MDDDSKPKRVINTNKNEFTFTLKRSTITRATVVAISLSIIALVLGLILTNAFRGITPAATPLPTPVASTTATSMPEVIPTPTPTKELLAPPQSQPGKTFTMPNVIDMNAIEAANNVLQLAPSAYLQFVDQNGFIIEARSNAIVVSTTPASGELSKVTNFIIFNVTTD